MPNLIILETTDDNGDTSLGKYTLPKILALAINVFEVLFKHAEK